MCPENCLSCVDNFYCTTCKAQKWGIGLSLCNNDCDIQCLSRECHDDTGYCIKCEQGKYGRKCQYSCGLCKNGLCDLYKCTEGCKSGYFPYQTYNDYFCGICSENCAQCINGNICSMCNDGFYLQHFTFNNIVYVMCYQCTSGNKCTNYCSIDGCIQWQVLNKRIRCTDCPEGEIFNGVTCVQNTTMCSHGCSTNCDSNGRCLGNCKDGWTGDKCSELCNQKCSACSKHDKDICLQCKDNLYSVDCSLPCSQSCKKEVGKQTCDITDGYCLNGCEQSFWGDNCNQSCSSGCINPVCDRKDGTCSGGCKDGFIGEKCTQIIGL